MKEICESDVWRESLHFRDVKLRPDSFFNSDKVFEYVNLNPQGVIGVSDFAFQILKMFRGDLEDQQIAEIIVGEMVEHGFSIFDGPALDRIIRKYLEYKPMKLDKHYSIQTLVESDLFPPETEDIIIRYGTHLVVYDPELQRFYGCHPIPKRAKVSKVFIRKDLPIE